MRHQLHQDFLFTERSPSVDVTTNKHSGAVMIEYNAGDVPHDVIDYFKQFNIASKLYRELLDKGEKLMASARIVLAEEVELRKSVIASGKGAQGPECMAALNEGIGVAERM